MCFPDFEGPPEEILVVEHDSIGKAYLVQWPGSAPKWEDEKSLRRLLRSNPQPLMVPANELDANDPLLLEYSRYVAAPTRCAESAHVEPRAHGAGPGAGACSAGPGGLPGQLEKPAARMHPSPHASSVPPSCSSTTPPTRAEAIATERAARQRRPPQPTARRRQRWKSCSRTHCTTAAIWNTHAAQPGSAAR